MPVLDRQALPGSRGSAGPAAAHGWTSGPAGAGPPGTGAGVSPADLRHLRPSPRGLPPRSVPETRPTPLQRHYVLLSVIPLVCGAIAITALELGVPLGSPLVKLCVLLGAPILVATTSDATVRIWRSAWAWMPADRGRGLFRLGWVLVSLALLALAVAATAAVLAA